MSTNCIFEKESKLLFYGFSGGMHNKNLGLGCHLSSIKIDYTNVNLRSTGRANNALLVVRCVSSAADSVSSSTIDRKVRTCLTKETKAMTVKEPWNHEQCHHNESASPLQCSTSSVVFSQAIIL
jgi:hypothetical protein